MKMINRNAAYEALYNWYKTSRSQNKLEPIPDPHYSLGAPWYSNNKWILKGKPLLVTVIPEDTHLFIRIFYELDQSQKCFTLPYNETITIRYLKNFINRAAKELLRDFEKENRKQVRAQLKNLKKLMTGVKQIKSW